MQGLCLRREPPQDRVRFDEVISPVVHLVSGCYWIVSGCLFLESAPTGERFEEGEFQGLVVERQGQRRLVRPGFLAKYARLVGNDWCHLLGLTEPVALRGLDIDEAFLSTRVRVYVTCVDAVYWELFSSEQEILRLTRGAFPGATECPFGGRGRYWG
jgi:hypothetical protein